MNKMHLWKQRKYIYCGEDYGGQKAFTISEKSKNIKSWIIFEKATSCSC